MDWRDHYKFSFCLLCINSSVHTSAYTKSCIHVYFLVVWPQHRKVRWLILNRNLIMPSHARPNQGISFPVSSGWSVWIPAHSQLIRRWHHSFKISYLLKGSVPFQPSFPPFEKNQFSTLSFWVLFIFWRKLFKPGYIWINVKDICHWN